MLLDKLESGLLTYETEQGLFHAKASGWQRFHLLWTFRNFNSLPVKLLNAREQRLVESLYRTKLVHLPKHPGRDLVIGTVEQFKLAPVIETASVETNQHESIAPAVGSKNKGEVKRSPKPGATVSQKSGRVKRYLVFAGGAVCALMAIFGWDHIQARPASAATMTSGVEQVKQTSLRETVEVPLAVTQVASADVQRLRSAEVMVAETPQMRAPVSDEANKQPRVVAERKDAKVSTVAIVARTSTKHEAPAAKVEPKVSESVAGTGTESSRIQISRSPAKIVYPIYPSTSVKGKVGLKAILTAEGAVSSVEILSGDHVLANAAARAVRRWHFPPYYRDGKAVESETNIIVFFIAPDAIVISFPSTASFTR